MKNQVLFNVATAIDKNIMYKLHDGAGGAISILYNAKTFSDMYDQARFVGNRASRGGAFYLGGRFKDLQLFGGKLQFEANDASMAGGGIFIEMSQGFPPSSFLESGILFKENKAGMAGNDYSTSCQNLILDRVSLEEVEIGKLTSIGMNMVASFNQSVSLGFEKLVLYHPSLLLKINKLAFNTVIFTPYLTSNNMSQQNVFSDPLSIFVVTEIDKMVQFNLTLKPCEEGFRLVDQVVDGKVVYSCEPHVDTLTLIISIVVPLSVVMLLVGIALIYGIVFVIAKLRLLRRKEKAERDLERKLMDKRMIFNLSEDEIHSQVHTELAANSTTHLNHSKSGRPKSQKSSTEMDAPLLEKSFLLEPIEYLNKKSQTPSFIISVDKLQIIKKIGEGGNGVVYLAKWMNLDVAIKSLKAADDQEFEKEALILSNLRHPNIVPFYELCITENSRYIVTQYLAKGSLDKVLYQCRIGKEVLTLKQRIEILLGTSHGMEYLHSLRPVIVHRDLVSCCSSSRDYALHTIGSFREYFTLQLMLLT